MLSRKEKNELVKDGYSAKRRRNFARGKSLYQKETASLDEYIHFLMEIQSTFSPFLISKKKTLTSPNKL